MALANVILLYKLHAEKKSIETWRKAAELPSGVSLPALRGADLAGQPITLPDIRNRTLLLVFSTSCGFCEANWPNWQRLIREKPRDVDVALINVSSTVDTGYLARHGVGGYPVMQAVDPQSTLLYRLGPTPQTILIEPGGVVHRVWSGELQPDRTNEVEAEIRGAWQ